MSKVVKEMTVSELAAHVGGRVTGDDSVLIRGIASLESAADGEIAFVGEAAMLEIARSSRASCLIVSPGAKVETNSAIEVKNPKLAFALIGKLLHARARHDPGISPTAHVSESANIELTAFVGYGVEIGDESSIGAGTQVHAGAVIGSRVRVGFDCVIHPNVVLYDDVTLGDRVVLHAGVIIGADGFGYVPDENNVRHKFPQIGTVVIEDDVEIGACSCIDRAALGTTRIGRGSKIDNLVQIAHNVDIGERVVIAAQTGISGSTVIEDDAVIGGQVGLGDHARVQSGAIIGSKAGILPGKIVRAGVWWGIPVMRLEEYKRLNAHIHRLPELREDIKELRAQVAELQKRQKAE
ncbi:MAG: UDP-3-O-[3-hydroxymyristoyl] glucosamine N-acyltransferase [Acidobacteriota bacterium]|jgi:UDP-3-O-[3-hydroxymyristoyl] glucosamine N-acyltransferase|nr:UDP-3-O-[3-hydroxymyristoyl] glucosamine N-acyltransferase [Acidobacteriota bacterium]